MARRVSWTNNSSGHSGTYVYRAPTLDPQNLPAPVATVDPVAQGATAEWVDDFTGYECYAVQDFDGQGVGALSAEVCISDPFATAQVGDEIGGGIYSGIHTISGADYHIVAAKQEGEATGERYKVEQTTTAGTYSDDDGLANTNAMVAAGISDHPAAQHCVNYNGGGNNDWYLPAKNELDLVYTSLASTDHPEFSTAQDDYRWASTEGASVTRAWAQRFTDGTQLDNQEKYYNQHRVRPIRRVAA